MGQIQNYNEDAERRNLMEVQKYILDVLIHVIEIMDKMKISYYMQGGTMLGAIRHKGFIPWDDDVDIGVPRAEYERFLKQVERYLPENLELHTYWDKTDHHYYFSRIVDTRYLIKRMGGIEVRYENVWVDIFPLDGMPNKKIKREIHKARLLWNRLLYHLSCFEKVNIKRPGRPFIERLIIKMASIVNVGKFLDTRKMLDKIDSLLKKYPLEKSEWIINFMGQTSYRFNEMFKKEVYGKPSWYQFENIKLIGPEKYDEYLKSLYGDYMKPPKMEDRNAHTSELVRSIRK